MADRDENRLINEAGVKAPANIKYHAGFVSGLDVDCQVELTHFFVEN